MLLVITVSTDNTMNLVTDHVQTEVIRLNYDSPQIEDLSYGFEDEEFHCIFDGIDLQKVSAVWYRIAWVSYAPPPKENPNPYWLFNRVSREEMIKQIYGVIPRAKWFSSPYSVEKAENKMFQLEEARRIGLEIPVTLVTSSPEKAISFRERQGVIITKPVAKELTFVGDKIHAFFTSRITPEMQVDFSGLKMSPAIFQKEVVRICDIRSVVIGKDVFSVSIHQVGKKEGGVDWRVGGHDDLVFKTHHLPSEINRACINLVENLNLEYGAIDFVLGKDGIYYFLEINPTGSWVFVEKNTGQPLARAMANLLRA